MLISGHIFIMPQRRFKFKLCRLARGERSLDSLPIIQLLLPSPSLVLSLFLPPLFILVSLLFISREVLSPGWTVDFPLSFCPLCPRESSREKVSHFYYMHTHAYMCMNFPLSVSFFFGLIHHWLEDFFFQMSSSFVCSRFPLWTWRRRSQIKVEPLILHIGSLL